MSKKIMKAFLEFMKNYEDNNSTDGSCSDRDHSTSDHDDCRKTTESEKGTSIGTGHLKTIDEEQAGKSEPSSSGNSHQQENQQSLEEDDVGDEKKAELTLCGGKKSSHWKKTFRHIMKISSMEAKVWGIKTFRQLESVELKWIHDRILSQCSWLKGRQKDIDQLLGKALIEAKYYRKKSGKESIRKSKKKLKKKHKHCRKSSSSSSEEDGKSRYSLKSSKGKESGSRGIKAKLESQNSKKTKRCSEKISTKSNRKEKDASSRSSDSDSHVEKYISDYERNAIANRASVKSMIEGIKNDSNDLEFSQGQSVVVNHHNLKIATSIFKSSCENGMYANLVFQSFITEPLEDIELPIAIPQNQGQPPKTLLNELENGDTFVWKLSKLQSNCYATSSYGRYIYGEISKQDTALQAKRKRKPNKKYLD